MKALNKNLFAVLILYFVATCYGCKEKQATAAKETNQKEKTNEQDKAGDEEKRPTLVGKWAFHDIEYTPAYDNNNNISPDVRNERLEGDKKEAQGTVFEFFNDNSYTITTGLDKRTIKGTYTLSGTDLTVIEDGKSKKEELSVSYPGNGLIRIEETIQGVAVTFKKVQ